MNPAASAECQIGRSNDGCRIVTPRSPPTTVRFSQALAKLVEALKLHSSRNAKRGAKKRSPTAST